MTYRASEEYLPSSEEFSPFSQPGSVLFSQPSEVDNWCHSISLADGYPLTPPDTASECSLSDGPDMAGPAWHQTSLPEESWRSVSAPGNSTMMQSSVNDWRQHGVPITTQELQALDSTSWLNVSQGPVDMGLSPVLSQESQNTHTLSSLSEPELPLLPPGLDLSFIGEPTWDPSGAVLYSTSGIVQDCTPFVASSPQKVPVGLPEGPLHSGYGPVQRTVCEAQHPINYYQGGLAAFPRRAASDPSAVQHRPLLPVSDVSQSQAHGHYPAQQSHPHSAARTETARVSSIQGQPDGFHESVLSHGTVPRCSRPSPLSPGSLSPRADTVPPTRTVAPSMPWQNDDFSNFVRYDQEEKSQSAMASDSHQGPITTQVHHEAPPIAKSTHEDAAAIKATSSTTSAQVGEVDEGRYRSHPLYNEGPQPDGLYHCPFKSDPNCGHKPTKLKCNYDKFIDSHLKPFRCKVESCSKQEFSSTACLLRHEREAHGMHGHGDRPHLCFYPGCERGIPGNGFPRRYNLFDHMKRVHDHKEEAPVAIPEAGSRKSVSRKRKSPGSLSDEPVAQRQKMTQQPTPPPMVMPMTGYASQVPMYPTHPRNQRAIYSQWANQRELLEFQMSSVQGPQDEANLQRLSQNVEELRRLSHQARHG